MGQLVKCHRLMSNHPRSAVKENLENTSSVFARRGTLNLDPFVPFNPASLYMLGSLPSVNRKVVRYLFEGRG